MNLIQFLKYRYCRAHMLAYLHGELPITVRQRVARYIDEIPACYSEYLRQRDTMRELSWKVPLVGQPEQSQLDRAWSAIQAELNGHHDTQNRIVLHARYGFAGIVLGLALMMPFTLGNRDVPFTVPSQPAPHTLDATSVAAASGTHVIVTPAAAVLPKATPEVATSARR